MRRQKGKQIKRDKKTNTNNKKVCKEDEIRAGGCGLRHRRRSQSRKGTNITQNGAAAGLRMNPQFFIKNQLIYTIINLEHSAKTCTKKLNKSEIKKYKQQ